MKNLVIVESPAKAKTIEKILGKDFEVMSSYGHIRDLAKKEMSIDIDNSYNPEYQISEDKTKLVADLKKASKDAEMVWLASDEDREGEAIAWHLRETLELPKEKTKRIVFNEITKDAILNSIKQPRDIDMNLVDAQQARRVLDRLVGYEISPILWAKIKPALSAGRVQSVAVRLIVERENEIRNFQTQSYYRVTASFLNGDDNHKLLAELNRRFDTAEEAKEFLESIYGAEFKVAKVETKPARRSPAPPFTTSTLQQEASRKLGYSVARTMQIAQQLYESGYITYMRTDSTNLSELALNMAKKQIGEMYGERYVKTRRYHTKIKGAQEAHEAIRPTYMDNVEINADAAQRRLYELIWKRAIASQMADAELEKTTIDINISQHKEQFTCSGEQVLFDGFLKVYYESTDDDVEETPTHQLPPTKNGEKLSLEVANATQHYTQHPPRYTEASLVKKLEDLQIGRPSTYSPTISTILKREYVIKEDRGPQEFEITTLTIEPAKSKTVHQSTKTEYLGAEKGKLFPTDIGTIVNQFLMEHFTEIMDYNFTAQVEKDFDDVANGTKEWRDVINEFYMPFHRNVKQTQSHSKRTSGERLLGTDPKTGKNVYAKIGRYGTLIQIGDTNTDEKPQFASMKKGQSIETITLEEALDLFSLPRTLGTFEGSDVVVSIGRFGPYVRHDGKFYSLSKTSDPYTITLEAATEIITVKRAQAEEKERLRTLFPHEIGEYEGEMVVSNVGKFGPYITYKGENYRMPKNTLDPLTITLVEAVTIIRESQEKKSRAKGRKKKSQ
ncbi:MAG: type I DNA topoisomerase [Bacteroidales bacterium]|nr:type I DNA topoisomerase [Bacteroidales bacterium]